MNASVGRSAGSFLVPCFVIVCAVAVFWTVRIWFDRPVETTPLSGDLHAQYLPDFTLHNRYLAQGTPPLWNPYEFAGMPLAASHQYGPFYPLTPLYALGDIQTGHLISGLIHLSLAGLFVFFFLRYSVRCDAVPALFGALVFALAGWTTTRALGYPDAFRSGAYIPLVLLLVDKVLSRPSPLAVAGLAGAVALQFLAGEIEIAVRTAEFAAVFAVCVVIRNRRTGASPRVMVRGLVGIGASALIALGLVAVQLIPTLQASTQSLRTVGGLSFEKVVESGIGSPWALFQELILEPGTPDVYFIGVLPVLLALYALTRPRLETALFLLISLVLFDLMLGKGSLLYPLYYRLPTGDWFRFPKRFFSFFLLSVTALTALGAQQLIDDLRPKTNRIRRWIAVGFVLFATVGTVIWEQLTVSIETTVLLLCLIGAVAAIGAGYVLRRPGLVVPAVSASVLAYAVLLPVFAYDLKPYNAPRGIELDGLPSELEAYLAENTMPSDRIYADFALLDERRVPKIGALLGIPAVTGFSPFMPESYWEFIRDHRADRFVRADDAEQEIAVGLWGGLSVDNTALDALSLLGVRYVVLGMASELYGPVLDPTELESTPGLVPVGSWGRLLLLRNDVAWPRAFLVPRIPLNSVEELRRAYSDARAVEIVRYAPQLVEISLPAGADGVVVLTDQAYPGWTATVDGESASIITVGGLFRGVDIPAGAERVRFTYRPGTVYWGVVTSAASIVLLTALAGLGVWRYKKGGTD